MTCKKKEWIQMRFVVFTKAIRLSCFVMLNYKRSPEILLRISTRKNKRMLCLPVPCRWWLSPTKAAKEAGAHPQREPSSPQRHKNPVRWDQLGCPRNPTKSPFNYLNSRETTITTESSCICTRGFALGLRLEEAGGMRGGAQHAFE